MADLKGEAAAPIVEDVVGVQYASVETPVPVAPVVYSTGFEASPEVVLTSSDEVAVGRWDAGFCSCFDNFVPNCLMVTFCPCVTVAQVVHRLGMYQYTNALIIMGGIWAANFVCSILASTYTRSYVCNYDSFWGTSCHYEGSAFSFWYFIQWALALVGFFVVFQIRMRVRARFEIPGSPIEDCLTSFFCSCCTMAQIATHVKSYKPGTCDFAAPDTLPAFE